MIHIITGPVHSGKTTLARETVEALKKEGVGVSGVISEAVTAGDRYLGYDGVDIKSGSRFPLLRKPRADGSLKTGGFYFVPEGLTSARGIIDSSSPGEVVIIDELGPSEVIEGRGLWQSARRVFTGDWEVLAVVRDRLLDKFRTLIGKQEVRVHNAGIERTGGIALEIKSHMD